MGEQRELFSEPPLKGLLLGPFTAWVSISHPRLRNACLTASPSPPTHPRHRLCQTSGPAVSSPGPAPVPRLSGPAPIPLPPPAPPRN